MTLQTLKVSTAAAWVLAIASAGLLASVTSFSLWLALAGLAIVPPLVMMRFWSQPDQTMSQSIQEILRK
jgi:hypothetical protein